jgi:hypothetical protein
MLPICSIKPWCVKPPERALVWLSRQPQVDPKRIAILGLLDFREASKHTRDQSARSPDRIGCAWSRILVCFEK